MSVTVRELKSSQHVRGVRTLTYEYVAWGSHIIDEIADAVFAASPPNYGLWVRQWQNRDITPDAGDVWYATVPYGVGDYPVTATPGAPPHPSGIPAPPTPSSPAANDPLGREWSFDFSGGTAHINQSIKVKLAVDGEGTPLLNDEAAAIDELDGGWPINVSGDGTVGGADIVSPTLRMTYTAKIPVVTLDFVNLVKSLIGCKNSTSFLTQEAGEVLFVGAGISAKESDGASASFTFEISENRTNFKIGGYTVTLKEGWDLLDVRYSKTTMDGRVQEVPSQIYIHQVYYPADLNELGLFI